MEMQATLSRKYLPYFPSFSVLFFRSRTWDSFTLYRLYNLAGTCTYENIHTFIPRPAEHGYGFRKLYGFESATTSLR